MTISTLWNGDLSAAMQTSTTASAAVLGSAWYSEVAGYIEGVAWGRNSVTADNRRPSAIGIFDAASGVKMGEFIPAATDTSNAGWFWSMFNNPIYVNANQVIIVAAHYPGTGGAVWRFWYRPLANLPTPQSPLHFQASFQRTITGSWQFPTSASNATLYALDVQFNSEYNPNPTTPATTGSVSAELAGWLALDTNDYPTRSLPYLNHGKLTVLGQDLADFEAAAVQFFNDNNTLMGLPLNTAANATLFGRLKLVQDIAEAIQTAVGLVNPNVDAAETAILDAVGNIPTDGGPCANPLTVGSADWTQVYQTTGAGGFAVVEPADAYKVTIEEIGHEARSAMQVGSEVIYWLRGWVCPWDGTATYAEHVDLKGPETIHVPHQRWPGIMLYLPPSVEWTLTAYDYTPVGP